MNRIRYLGLLVLMTGWTQFVHTQTNPTDKQGPVYRYSLEQCIDYALEHHKTIKNALVEEALALQKVREITGAGLPSLSGSFSLQDFVIIPTTIVPATAFVPPGTTLPPGAPEDLAVQFGIRYNATAGLNANWLVLDGGYFYGKRASKAYVELTRRTTRRTKVETIANVSKAYYSQLVNAQRLGLLESNIAQLQTVLQETRALQQTGFVEKIDVDRLEVQYNNLMTELDKARRMVELGNVLLKFQMGMPLENRLELTDKITPQDFNPAFSDTAEVLDVNRRPEYAIAQQGLKLQQINVDRTKWSRAPNLVAFGSLQTQALRRKFNFFDTQRRWYPVNIIGLTISVNIFNGFIQQAKIEQATLERLKTQNELLQLEQALNLEYRNARAMLVNALKTLEIQKRNLDLAREVYRVSSVKYKEGVGSNLEVVLADKGLEQAQNNYLNALLEAYLARIDLQKSLGNLHER